MTVPTIETKRAGVCSVCRGGIGAGELVKYARATGLQHPECAGQIPKGRPNPSAGKCSCGQWVPANEGALLYREKKTGAEKWVHTWEVRCAVCAQVGKSPPG